MSKLLTVPLLSSVELAPTVNLLKWNWKGNYRWWFIIHDTEEVLTNLESKWNLLKLQTLWELEPCYMDGPSTDQPCISSESPTAHQPESTSTNVTSPQPAQQSTVSTAVGPEVTLCPVADGDKTPRENPDGLSPNPPSNSSPSSLGNQD